MGEFAKLDPLLHSELRLAVMSTLLTMEEDRQALRGRVHLCRERICGEEAADGVQDYGDGGAGFRCIRRGLEVLSALAQIRLRLRLFHPSPNPFLGRGFGRFRSGYSFHLLLRKESKRLTTTAPNCGKCCHCGKWTKRQCRSQGLWQRFGGKGRSTTAPNRGKCCHCGK